MRTIGTLAELEQALRAKRDELARQIASELEQPHLALANSGDPADAAQDGAESELSSQLVELETRELQQIERALEQIRSGEDGRCESCHREIDPLRLEALPNATHCIRCARASSKRAAESAVRRWTDSSRTNASAESDGTERFALKELELERI